MYLASSIHVVGSLLLFLLELVQNLVFVVVIIRGDLVNHIRWLENMGLALLELLNGEAIDVLEGHELVLEEVFYIGFMNLRDVSSKSWLLDVGSAGVRVRIWFV